MEEKNIIKTIIVISIDVGKKFDKVQHPFLVKKTNFSKLRIKESVL